VVIGLYHISELFSIHIYEKLSKKRGENVYKKFAELLEKRKVTAYRVSKETGIPANTFTDWKNGRSKPKFDKLMALAKFFDVPVEYFHDEESRDTDKPQIRKGVQTMPHKIS
jgi:transcriptional regulator with XRE-family HTH domain